MGEEYDAELEAIRRRKLLELQRRLAEEERARQAELAKQAVLRSILTPEARQRLTNIKLVRPDFAEQLELQLIQLAQAGRIQIPIGDDQLKSMLLELEKRRKRIRIKRV